MTTERPTLARVAESAGVSVATVSKVLNGRSDVAAATRARVEDVLAEHQYAGQSRRRARGERIVELVVDHLHAPFTCEVAQGVLDAAVEHEVSVVVTTRQAMREEEIARPRQWARRLARAGRAGVVSAAGAVSPEHVAAFEREGLPVVLVDPIDPRTSAAPSVGSTNFTGGMAVGQHLVGLGHEVIGYVGGATRAASNAARLGGLRAALEEHRLDLDPELVTAGENFDYETGVNGGAELLDRPHRPTAIFAGSDEVAIGVVEAARRLGIRVPQDLSVAGFDDTPAALTGSPPLTTVRQPLNEMGRLALRTALRLADGGTIDAPHVALATRLVVRESTSPPAARR